MINPRIRIPNHPTNDTSSKIISPAIPHPTVATSTSGRQDDWRIDRPKKGEVLGLLEKGLGCTLAENVDKLEPISRGISEGVVKQISRPRSRPVPLPVMNIGLLLSAHITTWLRSTREPNRLRTA
jgi:hypothetical protein